LADVFPQTIVVTTALNFITTNYPRSYHLRVT